MKITFVGGGNMGEAMIATLLKSKLADPKDIFVSDKSESRRQYLHEKYAVHIFTDNLLAGKFADTIVLTVKPQVLPEVLPELKKRFKPSQLVISVIAGASLQMLRTELEHPAIIRCMPNTPSRIGEGISLWTATPEVSKSQRKQVEKILEEMGKQVYVEDEKVIDMATAVSGSGPAYFYYYIEAMMEAAVKLGFTPEGARLLVMQTIHGSLKLMAALNKEPAELRQEVTSPGGTTAAALEVLEQGGFKELIYEAVKAAHTRATELGS